jgi:hypothetical protein
VACHGGPKASPDGLVLSLDAGNTKGFDKFENLLLYGEDFSNAYWTKSNVSVTPNAIASPSGSSNASKLVESASTAVHELFRGSDGALSVGTDTYITFSIFAKAAERQYCYIRSAGNSKRIAVVVDLSNGTFNVTNWGFTLNSSATVTPYPNGWYRITATAQSNYPTAPGWAGQFLVSPLDSYQSAGNVGGGGYSYAGNGTSGIYIWGAHYEFGPGISDYYATTGTAKNRGSTLIDLSGRGNNGTLTNGPTFNSSNGGSIVLDSVDDYIDCGLSSFQPTAITLCAWVKHTVSADGGIIVKGDVNEATEWGMSFGYSSPHYLLGRATTYFNQLAYPWTGSLLTGFHYVCYTMINNTSASLYVDGALVSSTNTIGSIGLNAKNVLIGKWNNYAPLNGNIAQVKIYNRALTALEIQQNYIATKSRYGL